VPTLLLGGLLLPLLNMHTFIPLGMPQANENHEGSSMAKSKVC